jgi:hypothetical protein
MDRSDLVMSVVFADKNAFGSDLSKDMCRLLMQTSPALCKSNHSIMQACNVHTAVYWYEEMHEHILDISVAKYNKEYQIGQYEADERHIVQSIKAAAPEIQEYCKKLLVAEYREYAYLSIFDRTFEEIETYIFDEYARIVELLYKIDEDDADIDIGDSDEKDAIFTRSRYFHLLY